MESDTLITDMWLSLYHRRQHILFSYPEIMSTKKKDLIIDIVGVLNISY